MVKPLIAIEDRRFTTYGCCPTMNKPDGYVVIIANSTGIWQFKTWERPKLLLAAQADWLDGGENCGAALAGDELFGWCYYGSTRCQPCGREWCNEDCGMRHMACRGAQRLRMYGDRRCLAVERNGDSMQFQYYDGNTTTTKIKRLESQRILHPCGCFADACYYYDEIVECQATDETDLTPAQVVSLATWRGQFGCIIAKKLADVFFCAKAAPNIGRIIHVDYVAGYVVLMTTCAVYAVTCVVAMRADILRSVWCLNIDHCPFFAKFEC